jgi:hypothetical protein
MNAVAYPINTSNPAPVCWRGVEQVHRSARTSPWSRIDEPSPSAAASTSEPVVFDSRSASWVQPVVDRLNYLLRLDAGWGGPGTVRLDKGAVERAVQALALVASAKTRPPSISPGTDGSLQLAWYMRDFELEIDVPVSGEITISLFEHETGEEAEFELTSSRLSEVIEKLRVD